MNPGLNPVIAQAARRAVASLLPMTGIAVLLGVMTSCLAWAIERARA